MTFDIYRSSVTGVSNNTRYPVYVRVENAEDLKKVVLYDHVCAEFRDSIRGNDNFVRSNVLPMDCDNDHSENPDEWITPEKLESIFAGISYAVVFSRNNMKAKEGKSPRPRFHVYFAIDECTESVRYTALKRELQKAYPFFDSNALDASRFLYGVKEPQVIWNEGFVYIDEDLKIETEAEEEEKLDAEAAKFAALGETIPEGQRNSTLLRSAERLLKRYGNDDETFQLFLEESDRCEPPLEMKEINSIWRSAVRFYETRILTDPNYVPPESYNRERGTEDLLKPEDYSDMAEAKIFADDVRGDILFTDNTDYLVYNGNVWEEDKHKAFRVLESFTSEQLDEAIKLVGKAMKKLETMGVKVTDSKKKGFLDSLTDEQLDAYREYLDAKAYHTYIMKSRNGGSAKSVFGMAKSFLNRSISELDTDEFLLNTPGMTYDLREGLSGGREPQSEDLITRITACPAGDDGKELWEETLNTIFCCDSELIEYVHQIVGLAAIGKVYQEALIIAYGSGSNGKSTFWNTIASILGNYSCTISADSLTPNCKRNVKPEMAELKGRRLAIASELEDGVRLSTSLVKQLCSTDEISAEKKFQAPFKFTPSHTLVLYTNFLPHVRANDEGTWRRLIVIPFNAVLKGSSDKKNYTDYLCRNAGPAIMKWIIEGAQAVIRKEFRIEQPQCVRDASLKYKEDSDWLSSFLEECCIEGSHYTEKSGDLYTEYRSRSIREGDDVRSKGDFYQALENAGFKRKRNAGGVTVFGLKLKGDFLNE